MAILCPTIIAMYLDMAILVPPPPSPPFPPRGGWPGPGERGGGAMEARGGGRGARRARLESRRLESMSLPPSGSDMLTRGGGQILFFQREPAKNEFRK